MRRDIFTHPQSMVHRFDGEGFSVKTPIPGQDHCTPGFNQKSHGFLSWHETERIISPKGNKASLHGPVDRWSIKK